SALAMAGALMGIEVVVYMVRASYHHKPGRRHLMETFGATILPSPGESTEAGRRFLADDPDHPGSEATAVSEALEVVASPADAHVYARPRFRAAADPRGRAALSRCRSAGRAASRRGRDRRRRVPPERGVRGGLPVRAADGVPSGPRDGACDPRRDRRSARVPGAAARGDDPVLLLGSWAPGPRRLRKVQRRGAARCGDDGRIPGSPLDRSGVMA